MSSGYLANSLAFYYGILEMLVKSYFITGTGMVLFRAVSIGVATRAKP